MDTVEKFAAGAREARFAAVRFAGGRQVLGLRRFGTGNVHETFLVRLAGGERFLLQRFNTRVFPRPDLVAANHRTLTEHMARRLESRPLAAGRRWAVPQALATTEGLDLWIDDLGEVWRAQRFMEGTHSTARLGDQGRARELGWALGTFHRLLDDLPADRLADTLEGFHVTPRYLARFDAVRSLGGPPPSLEVARCFFFVEARRDVSGVLEQARERGAVGLRAIHGDPKVDNVLFDNVTGGAVSLVDLDTAKPGLLAYDLGDCLRSGCNPAGEEAERLEEVRFDVGLAGALLEGYGAGAGGALGGAEAEVVYDAARLIAFELGLRFLTDHLEGDPYFRTLRPGHNLARARVQFRLVESIEAQEGALRAMAEVLRRAAARREGRGGR